VAPTCLAVLEAYQREKVAVKSAAADISWHPATCQHSAAGAAERLQNWGLTLPPLPLPFPSFSSPSFLLPDPLKPSYSDLVGNSQ